MIAAAEIPFTLICAGGMDAGTALLLAAAVAGGVVGSYAIYLGRRENNHGTIATGGFMILMGLACVLLAYDWWGWVDLV